MDRALAVLSSGKSRDRECIIDKTVRGNLSGDGSQRAGSNTAIERFWRCICVLYALANPAEATGGSVGRTLGALRICKGCLGVLGDSWRGPWGSLGVHGESWPMWAFQVPCGLPWALVGRPGPLLILWASLGCRGPPWALMGQALVGHPRIYIYIYT